MSCSHFRCLQGLPAAEASAVFGMAFGARTLVPSARFPLIQLEHGTPFSLGSSAAPSTLHIPGSFPGYHLLVLWVRRSGASLSSCPPVQHQYGLPMPP